MNPELEIQDGIYSDLSTLLTKADSMEKASAYFAHYFQGKMHEGIISLYDYTLNNNGVEGLSATVEFSFAWNAGDTCSMIVLPRESPATAYARAMAVV